METYLTLFNLQNFNRELKLVSIKHDDSKIFIICQSSCKCQQPRHAMPETQIRFVWIFISLRSVLEPYPCILLWYQFVMM